MKTAITAFAVACALIIYLWNTGGVGAQEHRHPPEDAGLHDRFYKNWKMPDNRALSCCNDQDCAPVAAAEKRNGTWYAQRKSDLKWLRIPPEKVERERDAPDARAHMCSLGDHVFCFIVAGGV